MNGERSDVIVGMMEEVELKWARGNLPFGPMHFGIPKAESGFARLASKGEILMVARNRAVMTKEYSEPYRHVKLGGKLV